MEAGRFHKHLGRRGPARSAIIEDGSTWNETFLNLYNDRVIRTKSENLNKKLRFYEGYIGHQSELRL